MSEGQASPHSRFVVRDAIGQGGMGVVYRAFDRVRGAEVALKTLRQVDGGRLLRFKTEFRALAGIVHPNLVTLYELLGEDDRWYFTMELVEGTDFLDYVRPFRQGLAQQQQALAAAAGPSTAETVSASSARGQPAAPAPIRAGVSPYRAAVLAAEVDWSRLRAALAQLVHACRGLHAAGKLHRDLKPSNVLVDRRGRVVVCDFGLIVELREGREARDLLGTPAYASPEQVAGEPLSEASDWYSVGVMLYEAITGRVPFAGAEVGVLEAKLEREPPPPRRVNPHTPPDLDQLCAALLRRDPTRRPRGERLAAAFPVDALATPQPADTPFVGRAAELAALEEAWAAVDGDHCSLALVAGPSGIGKSALIGRFLEQHRERALVLEGRCYERESVPHKGLDALVDALSAHLGRLPDGLAAGLIPREAASLARLFPVLRQVPAFERALAGARPPSDPQELRARAFPALRVLLRRLAERRPVLLYVDDLQWGDLDSAPFFTDLVQFPSPPSLLLVAAYRSDEAAASPLLRALLRACEEPSAAACIRHISVGRLEAYDAAELAATLIDERPGAPIIDRLVRDAAGNPFLLAELARDAGERARPGAAAISLDEILARRVAALPSQARALLEVAAVAGRPTPVAVLASAAGIEDQPGTLALLSAARLIRARVAGALELVEPYHDRIRETVVARLAPDRARGVARSLAMALEAAGHADPLPLTQYWLSAAEPARAGAYALRAAEVAHEQLAFGRAARHYLLALELLELDDDAQRRLRALAGDALAQGGNLAEAAEAYQRAAEGAERRLAIDLRRRALEALLRSGRMEEGLALAGSVLESVGLRLPRTSSAALASVLFRRARLSLRRYRFHERRAEALDPELALRTDVCWSVSSGLSFLNPHVGLAVQMRQIEYALASGDPYRAALALSLELGFSSIPGTAATKKIDRLAARARELVDHCGSRGALGFWTAGLALARFLAGRFGEAARLMGEAEELMLEEASQFRWQLDLSYLFRAAALFYLGRLRDLSTLVPALLREALDRGDLYLANGLRSWRGQVAWLVIDQPHEARRHLEDATRLRPDDGAFHLFHYYELLGHTQIDLYLGEAGAAAERLERVWKELERSMLLRIQSVRIESQFMRARTALARAQREPAAEVRGLAATARRAAARIEREQTDWGRALAAMARGGAAMITAEPERAERTLTEALDHCERAELALHGAVTRRRLGQLRGGDEGAALVAEADGWMRHENVADPAALARMLLPWPE